jgi:hypothetical protein
MRDKGLPRSRLDIRLAAQDDLNRLFEICTVDVSYLQIYNFKTTPSMVLFMSNSTDNFGNTDPFSDEDAEQHQWKPEPSEDDLGFSEEHSGTS